VIIGHADLIEMANVIARADLFIGCDSGPIHLATFLGVRSIGLYGPAAPELTRPVWSNSVMFRGLYHPVDCSPCDQRRCVRPGATCMGLISVGEVAETAKAILGASHERTVAIP